MGQPISEAMLQKLASHPEVLCVTPEHIVLKDLSIRDPSEFVAEKCPVIVIAKLIRCSCGFGHKSGFHEARGAFIKLLADGREERTHGQPRACPNGQWTIEEVIPWEVAVQHESLLRSAGIVQTSPKVFRVFSRNQKNQ